MDENKAFADYCAAISELDNPIRNQTVKVNSSKGTYTFDYADLASIMDGIRPVFKKYNLALVQPVSSDGKTLTITTKIIHASGVVVEQSSMSDEAPSEPKALGSLITYLRRYALTALVGIAADDDDDGSAAQREPAVVTPKSPPKEDPSWVEGQASFIESLKAIGITYDIACSVCAATKQPRPSQLPADRREKLIAWLSTEAGKKKIDEVQSE